MFEHGVLRVRVKILLKIEISNVNVCSRRLRLYRSYMHNSCSYAARNKRTNSESSSCSMEAFAAHTAALSASLGMTVHCD